MNKDELSVNDVLDKLKIARGTLYNRIEHNKTALKPYMRKQGNLRLFKPEALDILNKELERSERTKTDNTVITDNTTIQIAVIQKENELLRERLQEKDKQIDTLTELLHKEQDQVTFYQKNDSAKIFLAGQDKQLQLEGKNKKPSLFNKLFKK